MTMDLKRKSISDDKPDPPVKLGIKPTPGVRQSFSCAECKRLKLKCSREWPCSSCVKRGCAAICPNGEMMTGKGKRLILADTEELHARISLLEAALAKAHGNNSANPHPLLAETYIFNKSGPSALFGKSDSAQPEEIVESTFGTLTIGNAGEARFVGSFAGSEYLRDGEERRDALPTPPATSVDSFDIPPPQLPPSATYAEGGIALQDSLIAGGVGAYYDLHALRGQLPDWETEGESLCNSYWDNVNWMYQIIPPEMFQTDHLTHAYDMEAQPNAHKLACVFLVMAIGVMFDLHRPPFHPRGERLFLLGRACLSAVGFEHSSPATVQALHLCGTYILNDKHGNGAEIFWPILGVAVKTAQSLGLHRDGTGFGLSEYEIAERRQVWWEVVTYDRLQALCFGRPCATNKRSSDTKFPEGDPAWIHDADGFHNAKYQMIEMMERVIEVQTQTAPVPYSVVSSLDAELRTFRDSLPETLLPLVPIQDLPLDTTQHPHLVIHRLGIRLQVAQTRLLLNRPSFARALKDRPEDPSRSKVGASFYALYESAQEIVQLVKQLVIYHPSLIARWWFFWFHAFSSAVCLSAIVIRAPSSAFAAPAFAGLSIVCDISHAARPGCRAKKGLPILMRLRTRARDALKAAHKAAKTTVKYPKLERPDEEDDLSHLVGSTKLRRLGSQAGSISPPNRQAAPLPPMTTPHLEYRQQPQFPNGHNHSPTDTISTSTTLAEPIPGIVPSFPADGYVPQTATSSGSGTNISSAGAPYQWLSDFSPQWSDHSILYNTSGSNGLVSPTSAGLTSTSYIGTSAGTGTAASDYGFFPTSYDSNGSIAGPGPSTSSGSGQGHYQPQYQQHQEYAQVPYDATDGSMEMIVDKDMYMALGIEQEVLGPGSGSGVDNEAGEGGGGQTDYQEVDFESWVNGLSGTY